MKKVSLINFSIQNIKTEQFALFDENFQQRVDVVFSTGVEVKVSNEKRIGVFLRSECLQTGKIVIKIVVSCHFLITSDSWEQLINVEESNLFIPKDFLIHLIGITAGTTRGILSAKTENTVFSKIIYPAIDGSEIFKEDAIIPLNAINIEAT